MSQQIIAIGSDHAGFLHKQGIIQHILNNKGYKLIDCGTLDEKSVDFPDYAKAVCNKILEKQADIGILICGTGIGMSIVANRYSNIRAALCHNEFMAKMAKAHNNSNVLVLGARVNSLEDCIKIIDKFLQTSFEGGRHIARLDKIEDI